MKVKVDMSRRHAVEVKDVDGHELHKIYVPFGIWDLNGEQGVLDFGEMMLDKHHRATVVDRKPHTETEDAVITVTDWGPV